MKQLLIVGIITIASINPLGAKEVNEHPWKLIIPYNDQFLRWVASYDTKDQCRTDARNQLLLHHLYCNGTLCSFAICANLQELTVLPY
jgi:hypothetical protein